MTKQTLSLGIWGGTVTLYAGGTCQEASQRVSKLLGGEAGYSECSGRTWANPNGIAVWVEHVKNTAVLAHEFFHVTAQVLNCRGMTLSDDSEEAYSYTLSYLLEQVASRRR